MVILGGLNGLEFIIDDKEKWGYVDLYKDDLLEDKDFYFVHAVNRAPMLLNKNYLLNIWSILIFLLLRFNAMIVSYVYVHGCMV